MSEVIIGRNAVLEALKSGREIEKITLAKGAEGSVKQIAARAREKPVSYTHLDVYKRQHLYISRIWQEKSRRGACGTCRMAGGQTGNHVL